VDGKIPQNQFYPWLAEFLVDPTVGKYYSYDVVLDDNTGSIVASRSLINSANLITNDDYLGAVQTVVDIFDSYGLNGFPYSYFYQYFEQYLTIGTETVTLLVSAFVVISAVLFLFILSPLTTLLICLVIAICLIDNVGFMYYWGVELNAISLVNLVVSIGVTVEFSSYIAKTFAESPEFDRLDRSRDSMIRLGASVFNGSFATLISIVVLAFAQYNLIVEYYFKMYFIMVLFAMAHAFVLLPVVLGTFGPNGKHEKQSREVELPKYEEEASITERQDSERKSSGDSATGDKVSDSQE